MYNLAEGKDLISIAYEVDKAASSEQFATRLFGDLRYTYSAWETARQMANVDKPGYLFYYDAHSAGLPGAGHGAQYGELFGRGDFPMKNYYVNFIKNGTPNGQGLPQWDYYGGRSLQWMTFDPAPKPVRSPLTKRMQIIETIGFPKAD